MLQRIEKLQGGELISLFFHPKLDFGAMQCFTTKDGVRTFHYLENGILPQLVHAVTQKGVYFSPILETSHFISVY